MPDFIKKPCQHCPFRHDVKPFLTPARGEELATAACHPYHTFPCHKTTESDDDGDPVFSSGEKQCAGFLTLKAAELEEEAVYECSDGFVPSYDIVYDSADDMIDAYEEATL